MLMVIGEGAWRWCRAGVVIVTEYMLMVVMGKGLVVVAVVIVVVMGGEFGMVVEMVVAVLVEDGPVVMEKGLKLRARFSEDLDWILIFLMGF